MSPTFILASGSPRRRELLASFGITFTVVKTNLDETQREDETPLDYVHRLCREKAAAALSMIENTTDLLVLAADTSVILDGTILGKPADVEEARAMLVSLRNRSHTVCTGLTLMRSGTRNGHQPRSITELTTTIVTMRDYRDEEIEAYIATGDPFDKAGGYAIQHEGFHPAAQIDGSYTNVMGLPLETLEAMLKRME
jgi:septum formation protein